MEFKIDTKPAYTILTPICNLLDANLTEALSQKWKELTESGSPNLIVDLHNCTSTDETSLGNLVSLHEHVYENRCSIVFTNFQNDVLNALKKNETDLLINVAPTMNEAIDIVSMEILERELFDEEM
ncbi:MAG TPA: STAS domain-containing protein [Flavipsychrobacter sp.]|nr:STAS domain-containing protein [Flavipsychrobacter sp.]